MEQSVSASAYAAKQSQEERLQERKNAQPMHVNICGADLIVDRGVYATSVDTELMIDAVQFNTDETFLEIGCGSGAISLLLAKKCRRGLATDINPLAVQNAQKNAELLDITNVKFIVGDGFANIREKFNVIICNPPYNNCPARDEIDRMFWDPDDVLKKTFFKEAASHLLPEGRIYFGWANFQDIDVDLPLRLAEENHLHLIHTTERPSHSGKYLFYVFEFRS